jgi:GntR family transcriptional regulator
MEKGIDRDLPIPYYYQLSEILQDLITSGRLAPGDQLASEPALCEQYGVSRTVVRQALGDLESEGAIERIRGKGTFVAAPKIVEHLAAQLTGLHDDVTSRGQTVRSRVLTLKAAEPPAHVELLLGLSPGDKVVVLERLRFVDDEAWVFARSYLPFSLCSAILALDLSNKSLYSILEKDLGLTLARATRTFEAVPAGAGLAAHLGIRPGAPVLLLKSRTFLSAGQPVEYFVAWHRGDRSRFEVNLTRQEIHRAAVPSALGQIPSPDAEPAQPAIPAQPLGAG